MGTGWRKAFCSTIQRNREFQEEQEQQQKPSPSPRSCSKFGFLSTGSNPSTPRFQSNTPKLRCKTNTTNLQQPTAKGTLNGPKLHCNTSTTVTTTTAAAKSCIKTPGKFHGSNPSSPRSPLSILKNTLRLSRSSCGVCMRSVKTNQGMAIYTAECAHAFHFPCIAEYTRKQSTLFCPVCKSTWKDVPLLTNHKLHYHHLLNSQEQEIPINAKIPQQIVSPRVTKQESIPFSKNCDLKAYNDDETLVSPTFNPIPQANETTEVEDVQEFQGFFVNSTPSDEASRYEPKEFRNIEVSLFPEAAIVAVGRTHETLALVLKVKAPSAHNSLPAQLNRAPVDLVSVLDVSGSMSGAKLQMLKRAMRLVISSLGSADRLSIVSFSATPKRLMPFRRMTAHGQRTARHIVDRLGCSQGTSVGEALKIAARILEDRRERNPVASVILLSDGPDDMLPNNNDSQHQRGSRESTTRFSHIEIPVHSSGLGRKFGSTHEPKEDALSKCVGGLLSVVLQDLRIQVGIASGSDPAEIEAVYSCNTRPAYLGSGCIEVGNLYAEEERELFMELRVPISSSRSHHVLSVGCSYKDPTTHEQLYSMENNLLVPRPQAIRSGSFRSERLRNLFIFTRALAESRRLIELNELTTAAHLLSSGLALVMQSKCESAEEFIRSLKIELAEVQRRRQQMEESLILDENREPLTPTSAWRTALKFAKVPVLKRSMSQVSDLHGLENARF